MDLYSILQDYRLFPRRSDFCHGVGLGAVPLSARTKKSPDGPGMKMLIQGMKAKKNPTEDELRIIRTLSQNYDITDKKYVEEIIAEIK